MVAVFPIAAQPGFAVRVVECGGGHRGWSEPEGRTSPELVLVRRGWFRRRTRTAIVEADPTGGYLSLPGDEETFAHPAGGDVCTAVRFTPSLWNHLFGEQQPRTSSVYVDAALELAHRRFVAATRQPDTEYALTESLLTLAQAAIAPALPHPTATTITAPRLGDQECGARNSTALTSRNRTRPSRTGQRHASRSLADPCPAGFGRQRADDGSAPVWSSTFGAGADQRRNSRVAPADRDIVAAARIAIVERQVAAGGLLSLAESLEVSPFRLSRAFTREMGVSLTRYRNRVRVGLVLERIEAGEPDLAVLAADLGFADQAHLTRTVKEHVGHTPTALRRLLRA